ncbi:hypothetical protein PSP31121_05405 [Pandoraea sputorum]|uniref:Uncharacterized protein n=1 Tax=Pandoraea sputorum TaxID=93222 RepID=A0A5E5BL40_9BURK|nr:hypothetical protein PSP31121_05405 [Pandoraea sputorum]
MAILFRSRDQLFRQDDHPFRDRDHPFRQVDRSFRKPVISDHHQSESLITLAEIRSLGEHRPRDTRLQHEQDGSECGPIMEWLAWVACTPRFGRWQPRFDERPELVVENGFLPCPLREREWAKVNKNLAMLTTPYAHFFLGRTRLNGVRCARADRGEVAPLRRTDLQQRPIRDLTATIRFGGFACYLTGLKIPK